MKISVITVCYNSDKTLGDAVCSVIEQDHSDIEYIIVDGGSTDNTMQVLEPYRQKIAKIISEKDKGIYDAINKGVEMATGDVVGLLHSDDLLSNPHVLSTINETFEKNDVDAVYADLQYVSKDDLSRVVRHWKAGEYSKGLFIKGWMPPHPTFYVKRNCYKTLGTYNLGFSISADYELMLRMIHKHEIRVKYIPQVLVKMRVGGKSNISLKNRLQANLEDRRAWAINGLKPAWYTRFLKPISKLTQF